jgi:phage portal protein BeeE
MPIDKDAVRNLLEFLEQKYPNTVDNSAAITTPFVNPTEVMKLLHFCWEDGLIECSPIKSDQKGIEDFAFIKISSKGIRHLRGI